MVNFILLRVSIFRDVQRCGNFRQNDLSPISFYQTYTLQSLAAVRSFPRGKVFFSMENGVAGQARNDVKMNNFGMTHKTNLRRRQTWITPCKRSATRGVKADNYSPQQELRSSSTHYGVGGRLSITSPNCGYHLVRGYQCASP